MKSNTAEQIDVGSIYLLLPKMDTDISGNESLSFFVNDSIVVGTSSASKTHFQQDFLERKNMAVSMASAKLLDRLSIILLVVIIRKRTRTLLFLSSYSYHVLDYHPYEQATMLVS